MPQYHYTRPCSVWWGSGGLINVKRWFALVSYLRGKVHLTAVLGKNCHVLFFRVSPCCAGCKGCWRMFERGALLAWSCWKPVTGTKRGAGWPPWGHFLSLRKKMVESSQGAPRDQSYNKKFKKPFIMIPIKSFNKNRLIIVKLHSFSLFSWLIFFYYLNSTEVSSEWY